MRNHSKTLFGLAAFSALLVGCGGGSGTTGSDSSMLPVSGGATLLTRTNANPITASGSPSTHTFGAVDAVVPAGVAVPAGSVAILTTATPILSMLGSGGLTVGGASTGVSLTSGALTASVALPPSPGYLISAAAPAGGFNLVSGTKTLTVRGAVQVVAPVLTNGTAGIPTSISGNVPSNGSASTGVVVHATYPAAFANAYFARLTISWTTGGVAQTITQNQTVPSSGIVTFSPFAAGNIPSAGVDTIKIELIED